MRLPNRESGPQNQPRAKVAVSVTAGRDASIGGIAADRCAVPSPVFLVIAVPSDPEWKSSVPLRGTGARKYAATNPTAIIPKRSGLLPRQNECVVLFTGAPFPFTWWLA